ncbi:MAG: NAD-binding protein [Streptosporangiales bacterium]|nr:NAD-binding protein [Streptosporangiales bacterium]
MSVPSAAHPKSILFAGVGLMGTPMVTRLAVAGHRLTLLDTDTARVAALAERLGAAAVATPGAAGPVDLAILMLPDSDVVHAVADGPGGLLETLPPGTLIVDMGSSRPAATVALAERADAAGLRLADAPVSGGVAKAETGELTIMFGGAEEHLAEARETLGAMGTTVTHTGPVGSGHAMKALNNLLSAIGLTAAAEVLSIGAKFGLDPEVMVDVINHSTGRNQATEVKYPKHVLNRAFDSGFALRLMVKDVAIAMDLAALTGTSAPLGGAVLQAAVGAVQMLEEGADHTEVVRYVERNAGVELR